MRIIWSENAKNDLYESLTYIANNSIQNADMIRDKMYNAIKLLREFPDMGAIPRDNMLIKMGYRMIIVKKYLIFYLKKEKEIHITAIIHGAMSYQHLSSKE